MSSPPSIIDNDSMNGKIPHNSLEVRNYCNFGNWLLTVPLLLPTGCWLWTVSLLILVKINFNAAVVACAAIVTQGV